VKHAAVLLCSAALVHCSCDLQLTADVGFACKGDGECAEGFFCAQGACLALGFDAGVPDAGTLSGALAFTSPPRTEVTSRCSAPLVFGLIDDAGAPQTAPFNVSVHLSGGTGLTFFADDLCGMAVANVTLPKGLSSTSFHFIGSAPGSYDVALSAAPLLGAVQTQTVVDGGVQQLVFTTPAPTPQLAGTCIGPLTVEVEDLAGNPLIAPAGGLVLDVTVAPSGLSLFSQPGCTVPLGSMLMVPGGAAGATFWASTPTGASYDVKVSGQDVGSAAQTLAINPIVHGGTCGLSAAQLTRTCAVDPPQLDLTRTFLVYQATGVDSLAQGVETTCVLRDAATVICTRDGMGHTVSVAWQTVELSGAHVDHYVSSCALDGGVSQTLTLTSTAPASALFTLVSTNALGIDANANDFFTATNDGMSLSLQWELQCAAENIDLQVVQLPGASVTRASGVLGGGDLVSAQSLMPASTAFTLATWRSDAPLGPDAVLCDRVLRFEDTAPNAVAITRGANNLDPLCSGTNITDFEVERVDLGALARTQKLVVKLDAGVLSAKVPIMQVDLTRTFVLAPGQSGGLGQAVGEGALTHLPDGGAPLGEAAATLALGTPTRLDVTRGTSNGTAVFTVYVVELQP
jgi:hypothetical protein